MTWVLDQVSAGLRSGFLILAHGGAGSLRSEHWHLLTIISRAGRVTAMIQEGMSFPEILAREEPKEDLWGTS